MTKIKQDLTVVPRAGSLESYTGVLRMSRVEHELTVASGYPLILYFSEFQHGKIRHQHD